MVIARIGYQVHLSTAEFAMSEFFEAPPDETAEAFKRRIIKFAKKAKDAGFMVHVFKSTSTENTEMVDISVE